MLGYIEQEIGNVKKKQDVEIKEKENKIIELEQVLEECKVTLMKKKEVQKEIEEQFKLRMIDFEEIVRFKEKEVVELKAHLLQNEVETKKLVQEVEKERNQAKENIAKLQQLFQ